MTKKTYLFGIFALIVNILITVKIIQLIPKKKPPLLSPSQKAQQQNTIPTYHGLPIFKSNRDKFKYAPLYNLRYKKRQIGKESLDQNTKVIAFNFDQTIFSVPLNLVYLRDFVTIKYKHHIFLVSFCNISHSHSVYNITNIKKRIEITDYLCNGNAVFRDAETGSLWLQINGFCFSGIKKGANLSKICSQITTLKHIETTVSQAIYTVISDSYIIKKDLNITQSIVNYMPYIHRINNRHTPLQMILGCNNGGQMFYKLKSFEFYDLNQRENHASNIIHECNIFNATVRNDNKCNALTGYWFSFFPLFPNARLLGD